MLVVINLQSPLQPFLSSYVYNTQYDMLVEFCIDNSDDGANVILRHAIMQPFNVKVNQTKPLPKKGVCV